MKSFLPKLSISLAASVALALTVVVPSAASELPDTPSLAPTAEQIARESTAIPLDIEDLQLVDGALQYALPGKGAASSKTDGSVQPRGIFRPGTTCKAKPTMRRVGRFIEWTVENRCDKTPASQYLPWFIKADFQRASVGSSKYKSMQGPFTSGNRWGTVGNVGASWSCLGTKKYKYRVHFTVNYGGIVSANGYSDAKKYACA